MLQWGTVLTNGCCSSLVGPITKVWQPFTIIIHIRKMSDINDVLIKVVARFLSNPGFLTLTRLNDQCSMLQVMRHCILTNGCCSSLVGPITKVWQPFTIIIHIRKMSDINDVLIKVMARFLSNPGFLTLTRLNDQCSMLQWGTVFSPMVVAVV